MDADTLALSHMSPMRCSPGTGCRASASTTRRSWPRSRCARSPAGSVGEAIGQLAEGRAPPRPPGATLMAVGLHPDARLFDVELVQSERYERVEGQMRGLIKRTPECALHVHVGVPDPDAAVAAMNGLRERLAAAPRARRELAVLVRRRLGHGELTRRGDPRLSGARHPAGAGFDGTSTWPRSTRSGPAAGPRTTRWSGGTRGRSHGSAPSSCARWTSRRPRVGRRDRGAGAGDGPPRCGGPARGAGARAGAALVELPGRTRRARRRDLLRRTPAPAARGGRAGAGAAGRAPTPSSRA